MDLTKTIISHDPIYINKIHFYVKISSNTHKKLQEYFFEWLIYYEPGLARRQELEKGNLQRERVTTPICPANRLTRRTPVVEPTEGHRLNIIRHKTQVKQLVLENCLVSVIPDNPKVCVNNHVFGNIQRSAPLIVPS